MADQPNLGYGKPTEASIDSVNQWMRGSTWYRDLLTKMGVNPDAPVKLSESQRQQVLKGAQAQGVVVDEGDMEVDPSGNFNPKGHKLRNTLIVAGIAGATLATMGAAGAFAGAGSGAAAGGSGAAAAGGVLPSTAIGTGMTGLTAGAVPVGMAGGAATGTLGAVGAAASGGSTLARIAGLAKPLAGIGSAISAGSSGAGNTRRADIDTNVGIHNSNVSAQTQFENELMNRAKQEQLQRTEALKNVYRASYAQHPNVSQYNTRGGPTFSQSYLDALRNLDTQGSAKLKSGPAYDTNAMPALKPIAPLDPTKPGTMEQIGGWLGPGVSTIGAIANLWGNR